MVITFIVKESNKSYAEVVAASTTASMSTMTLKTTDTSPASSLAQKLAFLEHIQSTSTTDIVQLCGFQDDYGFAVEQRPAIPTPISLSRLNCFNPNDPNIAAIGNRMGRLETSFNHISDDMDIEPQKPTQQNMAPVLETRDLVLNTEAPEVYGEDGLEDTGAFVPSAPGTPLFEATSPDTSADEDDYDENTEKMFQIPLL